MTYDIPSMFIVPPIAGQRRDLPRYSIPQDAAFRLRNLIRRGGKIVNRTGYSSMADLSAKVRGIFQYPHSDGTDRVVAATNALLWYWDGSSWASLTGALGSFADEDFPVFRVFTKSGVSYLAFCAGTAMAPKKWDGSAASISDIGGSPGGARTMAILANRMVLGNFSSAPTQIKVSDFNDFDSGWSSVQIANLSDTPGHIISINETGALVANVYKTDAWYVITASGGTYPFSLALRKAGIAGPMSPGSVVNTPTAQYILARDYNVYQCDGSVYTPLGDHIRYEVKETINNDKFTRSWGFYNTNKNEIWFFWPGIGHDYPNRGIIIKLDGTVWPLDFTDNWYVTAGCEFMFDYGITIGTMTQPLSYYTNPLGSYATRQLKQFLGTSGGYIYYEDVSSDFGTNGSVEVEYLSGMRTPSPEYKFTTVGQVESYFGPSSHNSATIHLYSSDEEGSTPEIDWSETKDLTVEGPFVLGCRDDARFFGIGVTGTYAKEEIIYQGSRVSGVERGRR